MSSYRPVPAPRPLESIARRGRARWGLRFFLLLAAAGVGAYYLRPYIKWIDVRAQLVEDTVRGIDRQYFGLLKPKSGSLGSTTPIEREGPPATAGTAARSGQNGAGAAIEPLPPRPARGAPAAAAKSVAAKPAPAAAVAAAPAAKSTPPAQLVRRRPTRESVAARPRISPARAAFLARRRLALASAAAAQDAETARAAAAAPLAAPSPKVAAAAAVAAPAEKASEPAARPAPPAEPAPPARNLVREAARSGDELDRLMAGALSESPKRTSKANARMQAEVDRKLAGVGAQKQKSVSEQLTAPAPGAAVTPGSERQPLDRDQIKTVMTEVQKQMSDCRKQGGGQGGIADLKIDVAAGGNVKSTVIKGDLAGTATGVCVENKVKAATFPPSTGLRFDYRIIVR